MKFNNVQAALDFIQTTDSPADVKMELMDLITSNAQPNGDVQFVVHMGEIQSVLFQALHDVSVTIDLESAIIRAFSLSQITNISIHSKENIMTAQTNTTEQAQLEAALAESMKKVAESSLESLLEIALNKQQVRIDEAVKKAVDAAMAAHNGTATEKPADADATAQAAATETTAAPEVKPETVKPGAQPAKKESVSLTKIAVYTAGAAAVAVGGFFAWQKWGSGSSAAQ